MQPGVASSLRTSAMGPVSRQYMRASPSTPAWGSHRHRACPWGRAAVTSIPAHAQSATQAALENPQPASFQSGIGLLSGWSCQGPSIAIAIDGGARLAAPYGSSRADTAGACGTGNTNSGFGLLVNFNLFGAGAHTAQMYVNGVAQGAQLHSR